MHPTPTDHSRYSFRVPTSPRTSTKPAQTSSKRQVAATQSTYCLVKRGTTIRTQGTANVADGRKQAVSIRMNASDVRKVKRVASRLGVRDSDVIRFAVKTMLGKLGPLYDPEVSGRNLVPVFVESGAELLRFFEIDATKLEAIINN